MTNKKFNEVLENAKRICDSDDCIKGNVWALVGSIQSSMDWHNLTLNAKQFQTIVNILIKQKY